MILMAVTAISALTSGCAIDRGPTGLALNPVPLHLRDGSYRPFNDVNSGSLPRWSYLSSVSFGDSYQSSFEHGNLMRY
jgi:hypothetical protein